MLTKIILPHRCSRTAYYLGQKLVERKVAGSRKSFPACKRRVGRPKVGRELLLPSGWSLFKAMDYAVRKAFSEMAKLFPKGQFTFDAKTMTAECDSNGVNINRRMMRTQWQGPPSFREMKLQKTFSINRNVRYANWFFYMEQSAAQLQKWQTAIEWYNELRERFLRRSTFHRSFTKLVLPINN